MKSSEHKQKAKEVRLGEKEQSGPEDSEELITVDAVGCFEDDDDEEDEDEDEEEVEGEEDSEVGRLDGEDPLGRQVGLKEVSLDDAEEHEKYCPDTVYGPDFLVPVAGFLCRLCRAFFHSNSAARLTHCKSLMHFENFQRYKTTRLQSAALHTDPWQGLAEDRQTPPAAGKEKPEVEKEVAALSAASKEACKPPEEEDRPLTPRNSSAALQTDDAAGALLIEDAEDDRNDFSTLSDHSSLGDAVAVMGEPVGLCVQNNQLSGESTHERSPGQVAADEVDPTANETSAGRDLPEQVDPSSLAKGETSAGRRRSTRHRAR
uniref:Uncharacterized protein n=2 Tax=Sphaerodactylus townsendi TaxID=933632 RepID=A0ACB8EZS5_9SAUR